MFALRGLAGSVRANGAVAGPLWRGMRGFACPPTGRSGHPDRGEWEEESPGPSSQLEEEMRLASEAVWPTFPRQRKFGSRVQSTLVNVILSNARFREELVDRFGLTVEEVRMSPDLSIAHVLWESCTGEGDALEKTLAARKGALRTALAKALRVRRVPELVFKRNQLSDKERELQRLLEEAERDARSDS